MYYMYCIILISDINAKVSDSDFINAYAIDVIH